MSSSWKIESLLVVEVDGFYKYLINEQKFKNNIIVYQKNQQVIILTVLAKPRCHVAC